MTKQLKTIVKVLGSTNSHPTAEWIYREVKQEIPKVSLGTIYRNLRELQVEGEILEINIDGSPSRFDYNTTDHCHFRCTNCEQMIDLTVPECSKIVKQLTRKRGLQITGHQVIFSGLCVECQKRR